MAVSGTAPAGASCPPDIDWYEVAAGLWPELKAQQLIMHAALCDHCGPLLRAATSVEQEPTPAEEKFLAQLKAPSRPVVSARPEAPSPARWPLMKWLVPAALAVAVVVAASVGLISRSPLSGDSYAEFAATTHGQHARGDLALDFSSDSQQSLNEWLKAKLPFSLTLPATPGIPGEDRPYRLEGARLVQAGGKPAVYISYRVQKQPVSLMVTPDSAAAADGGVRVDYKKVSFHYRMVGNYKVVTWSLKGRTYALVSQEANDTQRSCMVCHSEMRDRDLTQTPTPLASRRTFLQ